MSTDGIYVDVWLDQKCAVNAETIKKIEARTKTYLAALGFQLRGLNADGEQNLPSRTICIKTLRTLSPVTTQGLMAVLQKKGFIVPSEDWLSRRLDSIRKAGKIVRCKNGQFAVTLDGLMDL